MSTPEEILCRGRFRHPSGYRREPSLSSLHQNPSPLGLGLQVRLKEMELHQSREWGACWLVCHLYEQLELDEFRAECLPESREGTNRKLLNQN